MINEKLFTELYTDVTKKATKIPQENYLDEGNYPIVDQGKGQIAGRWNEAEGLCVEIPAIIFGDHTRAIKYIDEPFFIGADGVKVLRPTNQADNPKYYYYALQAARIPNLGYSRHFKVVKELMIRVYPRADQDQIVSILEKIDEVIEIRQAELLAIEQLVKSRFIEMFGEINAPSKWEKKPWAELVTIQNGRDYKHIAVESGGYAVYGTGGEMARASDYLCPENTIIVGRKGTINNPLLVKEKFWNVDTAFGVIVGEQLHYQYFYGFCRMFDFSTLNKQAVLPSTTKADLLKIQIAVPPIELQEQFAAFVEQVDKSKFYIQQIDEIYLLIIKTLSWRVKHDYN